NKKQRPRQFSNKPKSFVLSGQNSCHDEPTTGWQLLEACLFWQALSKSSSNVRCEEFLQRVGVVGKLPTTTGWQPVLPRIRETPPLPLWLGRLARLCSFARFRWRTAGGCPAGKLSVRWNAQYIGLSK